MMRILPNCPLCDTDGLCIYRAMNEIRLACIECGWRTTVPLVEGQDLDLTIAETVKVYADWLERARQMDPGDEMPFTMLITAPWTPPATPIATDAGKEIPHL